MRVLVYKRRKIVLKCIENKRDNKKRRELFQFSDVVYIESKLIPVQLE